MLDARGPPTSKDAGAAEEEIERELENEVTRLQHEMRMWRMSNHAFWIMWGIQKAKIPNLPDFDDPTQSAAVAAGPMQPSLHISMSSGTLPMVQSPIAEEEGHDVAGGDVKNGTETQAEQSPPEADGEEEEEEFDYLAYSWQRAMFF